HSPIVASNIVPHIYTSVDELHTTSYINIQIKRLDVFERSKKIEDFVSDNHRNAWNNTCTVKMQVVISLISKRNKKVHPDIENRPSNTSQLELPIHIVPIF